MKAPVLVLTLLAGCSVAAPTPRPIDPRNDACRYCRMLVSDPRVAAQIVAPGEEPIVFDDLGCLRDFLAAASLPDAAVVYVADHRAGDWVLADVAVYTKSASVGTGMGSGLIAHRDAASREADPTAAGGARVPIAAILSRPDGGRE